MCATTKFGETFQRIVATDALFSDFPNIKQQIQLFEHLKKGRNSLYKGLDADKRTPPLRETGDNFRVRDNFWCLPTYQANVIFNSQFNRFDQFSLWAILVINLESS